MADITPTTVSCVYGLLLVPSPLLDLAWITVLPRLGGYVTVTATAFDAAPSQNACAAVRADATRSILALNCSYIVNWMAG